MNNTGFMWQANNMMGGNIMNPGQQLKWMDKPAGDSSGLGYLRPLDFLKAKQVVSLTELFTGFESKAKFGVFNEKGEQIYYAFEESDFCQRWCCTKVRAFVMHVVDSNNQEIIRLKREFRCCATFGNCFACCDACKQEVVVESPPGTVLGYVTQTCSCIRANYDIKDANGNTFLSVVAPFCICDGPYCCCCENTFSLIGTDGVTEVGRVQKKYRGFIAEALTSADEFTVHFPKDLDVKMKAVVLGALFLIDFAHFSEAPQRQY